MASICVEANLIFVVGLHKILFIVWTKGPKYEGGADTTAPWGRVVHSRGGVEV